MGTRLNSAYQFLLYRELIRKNKNRKQKTSVGLALDEMLAGCLKNFT